MEEKPAVHAGPPANEIVPKINAMLREFEAPSKAQSASWTDARNLVLIVPTPDDANNLVTEFER